MAKTIFIMRGKKVDCRQTVFVYHHLNHHLKSTKIRFVYESFNSTKCEKKNANRKVISLCLNSNPIKNWVFTLIKWEAFELENSTIFIIHPTFVLHTKSSIIHFFHWSSPSSLLLLLLLFLFFLNSVHANNKNYQLFFSL